MSKVRIRIELVLQDQQDVIGAKEALISMVEQWTDVAEPLTVEVLDEQEVQTELDAMFDDFWRAYPRKTDKLPARRAFKRVCKTREMLATLLAALAEHKQTAQWQTPRLIPHAATWLNQHRWEDDLTTLQDLTKPAVPERSYDVALAQQEALHGALKYVPRAQRKETAS